MFNEPNPPTKAQQREHAEPSESLQPIPRIAALITLLVVLFGAGYIFVSEPFGRSDLGDQRTLSDLTAKPAGSTTSPAASADGAQIYAANCVACHQASGKGIPGVFPNLDASEWVSGDERIVINILLHGVIGEMAVNGAVYNGAMPAFGHLSDAELAAVATYIRSTWSNRSKAITPEQFAEERQAHPRTTPFGGEAELRELIQSPAAAAP
ncbi:MAG: cytochrome c [Gammaproteobacteria bacterium]